MSKMVDADLFLYLFRQIPFVMEHPDIREQFETWVEGLPETERTGQWIDITPDIYIGPSVYQCSTCGEIDKRIRENDNFCPYCGSYNGGEE